MSPGRSLSYWELSCVTALDSINKLHSSANASADLHWPDQEIEKKGLSINCHFNISSLTLTTSDSAF